MEYYGGNGEGFQVLTKTRPGTPTRRVSLAPDSADSESHPSNSESEM
jgi:hypothetical protein